MIAVHNKFIPALAKKLRGFKGQKPIADTAGGDVAFYVTKYDKKDESDDDEMSEYDSDDDDMMTDYHFERPQQSFTSTDWRPCFNDRMTMFIAGTPGAGKSYLAKQMIKLLPPTIPILLFTALQENDGNFDELGKERLFKIKMKCDEEFMFRWGEPINIDDLKGS